MPPHSITLILDGDPWYSTRKVLGAFSLSSRTKASLVFSVFDCLSADGKNLQRSPLSSRWSARQNYLVQPCGLL